MFFKKRKLSKTLYIRNIIFGIEDSLVSTVGLLSGLTVAQTPPNIVIIAGIVLIFVEATSMGVGSYISEHSAEHLEKKEHVSLKIYFKAGALMFISYFFAGYIPLAPYLFLQGMTAFVISVILALISLFILGVCSAKYFKINWLKHSLEVLLLGGLAVIIGVAVGIILHTYLNI